MVSYSSSNNCHFSIPYCSLILDSLYPVMSTSREIRNILFSDEERLIRLSELMNFLKVIMEDTEKKICLAKGDLELQTGAILRIRQLLKESSQNSDDPYHSFLRRCLKQTRGFGVKLEYLMSKLRLTARCLRDSNGETFTSMSGPVHVGGVIRTGGRRKVRRCDGEVRMSCGVTRGEGYKSGACSQAPRRSAFVTEGQGSGPSCGGARRCRRNGSNDRSKSKSKSKSSTRSRTRSRS